MISNNDIFSDEQATAGFSVSDDKQSGFIAEYSVAEERFVLQEDVVSGLPDWKPGSGPGISSELAAEVLGIAAGDDVHVETESLEARNELRQTDGAAQVMPQSSDIGADRPLPGEATAVKDHSMPARPAFLVTIDTEGDNLWSRCSAITTENARFLPRFQTLCEKYGVRPTWLANWEMANSPVFQEFAKDVLARKAGEVGMHLHAWNSPPLAPLTEDDNKHHPYLTECPAGVIREKVRMITEFLEETFGAKMLSHRAGRFGFDETYAQALIEMGYIVDGSVTPNISWKGYPGDPKGKGGPDYTRFPGYAYFVDPTDISRAGNSSLLEIPVTIVEPHFAAPARAAGNLLSRLPLGKRVSNHLLPKLAWLYPKGHNHRMLPRVLETVLCEKRDYAEFMMHSSELMPGGSPNFPTPRSIEELYGVLETLFATVKERFVCATMQEYQKRFASGRGVVSPRVVSATQAA